MSPLPRWLPFANRVIRLAYRAGLALGTIHVLTVPGRRTGEPRSTPVSPLTFDGCRYVIGLPGADWARNVRVAGRGELARGRHREAVTLTEVDDPDLRREVMRAFPREVPHGVPMFVKVGLVEGGDPEQFAAASDRVTAFRVDVRAGASQRAG